MPTFHVVTTWIRRIGGTGALENVSEVLRAREASYAQVETLAARVALMAPPITVPIAA